ncbi:hypothetical protein [Rhizobium sp. 28DA2]|uniref:hypothetical protein n=1 Tax=Rhizobium sp. 28DA2 TaxID=3035209 RepID=UPI002B252160|nr:hypothetical protein [Rhizobium sp. 28DA2]
MIKAFSQDEINEREAAIVLLDHERREIAKELTELPYCHCGNMHDYERSAGRAKPGWGNVVDNAMLSIKYQPERVGFLTIFTFFDTLAALDPKRQYDAAFASPADSESLVGIRTATASVDTLGSQGSAACETEHGGKGRSVRRPSQLHPP